MTNQDTYASAFNLTAIANGTVSTYCNALYVGGAGNVAVNHEVGNSTIIFYNVPAGTILPVRVTGIVNTTTYATTATHLIGLMS